MDGPYSLDQSRNIVDHYECDQCGGNLINPWGGSYGVDGFVVRCLNLDHQGLRPKGRETKKLMGVNYDIMTQKPVATNQALALPKTQEGMARRVQEAQALGLFPSGKNAPTREQLDNICTLALEYGLDPMMREIIPYQGQPYITLDGRRRIDDQAGNKPSVKIRPMAVDMLDAYKAMGAVNEGDVVVIGEFTDTRFGNTVEATGRVLKSETTGNEHLPTVKWQMEMAWKRCEARGRKMLYGPVALPGGAHARMRLVEEGDIVEGEVREIPETAIDEPQPPPAEPTAETPATDSYQAVLTQAGGHGLDLEAFCAEVLSQPSIAQFEQIGGTPAIAEKRLTAWLKDQEKVSR